MEIINKKKLTIDFIKTKTPIAYDKAISFMEKRVNLIATAKANELIWFLEHPSIFTTGRAYETENDYLENIPIYNTGRGGKLTWHGPGQRIIYIMINIKKRKYDIREFVSNLEESIIISLKELNINAYRKKNLVGIWTKNQNNNDAKIASLGLRISKGIIYHGISININCDLSYFKKIDPCGIKDSHVTSVISLKDDFNKLKIDSILKNNIFNLFI